MSRCCRMFWSRPKLQRPTSQLRRALCMTSPDCMWCQGFRAAIRCSPLFALVRTSSYFSLFKRSHAWANCFYFLVTPILSVRFNRLELIDPMVVAAIFGDANLSFEPWCLSVILLSLTHELKSNRQICWKCQQFKHSMAGDVHLGGESVFSICNTWKTSSRIWPETRPWNWPNTERLWTCLPRAAGVTLDLWLIFFHCDCSILLLHCRLLGMWAASLQPPLRLLTAWENATRTGFRRIGWNGQQKIASFPSLQQ